ncbi:hypothetical protein PIB30_036483 [Stylosanthes scabra]|uniref:Aminotransferase-like plant mobile domain-containing protein n=1 Tax=Stylosanthes scabra TaxID=79078 RepID=A0ABU6XE93_9FABA|nr:hypothetical protein [Stylosanthes scabra]
MWRMLLNGVDHAGYVDWTSYADPALQAIVPLDVSASHPSWALVCSLLYFAIVEWHQVDRVNMQLGASQHIPLMPLNIDVMHRHDGRWGRCEWYPRFLQGWYDMCHDCTQSRLTLEMVVCGVQLSRQYLRWYYQWAHLYLVGHRDPVIPVPSVIPPLSPGWATGRTTHGAT